MKELSIEQKAKAYDEAIKKAKSKIKDDKDHVLYEDDIIELFPELAESEDEKFRKEIVSFLNGTRFTEPSTEERVKWIAWLERQGEQKPILDVEIPFGAKDSELEEVSYYIPKGYHAEIEDNKVVIKKGEQKPAWSEEDEENSKNILYILNQLKGNAIYNEDKIAENCIDWLKALKERVQPKKQEWNYNDEIIIGTIIQEIEKIPSEKFIDNAKYRCLDWLRYRTKSLRPQSHWKPSEEQMVALKCAITTADEKWVCMNTKDLKSLYEDLKKLKG